MLFSKHIFGAMIVGLVAIICSMDVLAIDQIRTNQSKKDQKDISSFPTTNIRLLTGQAGLIFTGVASGIEYETDLQDGAPYTYITFRQVEPIKNLSNRFKKKSDNKLRLRLPGGLTEDGYMISRSDSPDFQLGAVYLVFYKAGPWSVFPIVGGRYGYFRVLRSRTLGYSMLFDSMGRVVVGATDEEIHVLPIEVGIESNGIASVNTEKGKNRIVQHVELPRPGGNKLYTEKSSKRILEKKSKPTEPILEPSSERSESPRVQALKSLQKKPLSLKEFKQVIKDTDDRYRHDFKSRYYNVDFNGQPMQDRGIPRQLENKRSNVK